MKRNITLLLLGMLGLAVISLFEEFRLLSAILLIIVLALLNLLWARQDWLAQAVDEKTTELSASDRRYRSLVEQASDGIFVLDVDSYIREVNSSALRMFGYEEEELVGRQAYLLAPASEWRRRGLKLHSLEVGRTISTRRWMKRRDGSLLPVEVKAKMLPDSRLLVFVRDITAQVQSEETLQRRGRALRAVSFSAEQFLRSGNWREQIQEVLGELGQAIDASRVYIFEEERDETGALYITQRYEWVADGITSYLEDPALQYMPVEETGITSWLEALKRGEVKHGLVRTFSEGIRFLLQEQQIQSLVLVPVFVGESFWGFLGFDECLYERTWLPAEIEAMQIAADTLGAAIQREQNEHQVRTAAARAKALVNTAARLSQVTEYHSVLDAICEETVRVLNVPSATISLFREEMQAFEFVAHAGLPEAFIEEATPVTKAEMEQFRSSDGTPAVLIDVQRLSPSPLTQLFARYNFRTVAFVDLIYSGRLLGILTANVFGETREFGQEELALLHGFANQAAQAIANSQLYTMTTHLLERTQQQWQQMQHIVDTVPEGVILIDASYRILLANPAGRDYLALLTDATVGDVLHFLDGQPLPDILNATGSERPWYELAPEGTERIFMLTERPMVGNGGTSGWVLVIRDVTEERKRQQHVQNQERLATVGQLAAGIAHDFNNIMAVITLYSQALERNPDFPRRQEYLATITKQAGQAADLISQILDFSRRAVMERGRLDLLPFVKEVVKLLQRTLPESIVIELEAEEESYLVNADPTRLQQALMNLALNARDAMPEGGQLHIRLSRFTLDAGECPPLPAMNAGEWMKLTVGDTGVGVDTKNLPHLFEPFFTTKHPGRGTGLGLAQVYGIVKQHGGEIEVTSVEGGGTTFNIYLPALERKNPDDASAAAGESAGSGQETILLVEDHEPTQGAIQDTLEMMGYDVLVASTGSEALELYSEHLESVDLVLSDMVMPEMGGMDLYHQLIERCGSIKMMVMTGYPLQDEGRSLLEQGIVDWISKPFAPDMLATKLRQVLDRAVEHDVVARLQTS